MDNLGSFVKSLHGKPILIYGLGRSGLSSVRALCGAGATVVVGDDSDEHYDIALSYGAMLLSDADFKFSDYAFLILSPGIPLTHPEPHDIVKKAQESDIEIICDIELFHRIYDQFNTIGVTGTNGKSTTSSLITHILAECGLPVLLGGNIGNPVFELDLDPLKDGGWIIFELSSFQIDLCPTFRPDIAVVMNIAPDHLDRHGSMENYAAVKERLLGLCDTKDDYNSAVICIDDDYTRDMSTRAKNLGLRNVIDVSVETLLPDGVCVDGEILKNLSDDVGDLSDLPSLKGYHNYQNAAVSFAVGLNVGLDRDDIWRAITSFPGLNHRQFLVRTINGVTYVNDSKATNAAATAVALGCRNNVYWIVGGRKKKNGLEGLEEFFSMIKHAFLIGEATDDFAGLFDNYALDYTRCYQMEDAVIAAHDMAQKNRGQPGGAGVVLLSPACASFDQYESFEDRGDVFSQHVKNLDEK